MAKCEQTYKNLIAYTLLYLNPSSSALSDYIWYSIQNNNIMANLSKFYPSIYGKSVFVSSNHTQISTIKLSPQIKHLLGNGHAKKNDESSNITASAFSKHKTQSFSIAKANIFDQLDTSANLSHLFFNL